MSKTVRKIVGAGLRFNAAAAIAAAAGSAAPTPAPAPGNPANFSATPSPTPTPAPQGNPAPNPNPAPGDPANPGGNFDRVATLRQEFATLQGEAAALHGQNRALTPAELADNDRRYNRCVAINAQIATIQTDLNRFSTLAPPPSVAFSVAPTSPSVPPGNAAFHAANPHVAAAAPHFVISDVQFTAAQIGQMRGALAHYFRSGQVVDTFAVTTAVGGGILMPVTIGTPRVVKSLGNPIRQALVARGVPVLTTDGVETINIPIFDDTGNTADLIAEDATTDNPKDPTVTGISVGALLRDSGTAWFSNRVLNSAGVDILPFIEPALERRLDKSEYVPWMTAIKAGTVGKVAATTTGITYPELLSWQHSVPIVRRSTGVFLVSDGMMIALRNLTDGNGRLIFQESARDDQPDRLLGWPVFVTTQLAAPAANAITGAAVAAEGLIVRDVRNRRVERYAHQPKFPDQFGLRVFTDSDFAFEADCVRLFKQSA